MTKWEKTCRQLGLDPVTAVARDLKMFGKSGWHGLIETTCQRCGMEVIGQHRLCLSCENKREKF
jgi:hypothetical protein